MENNTYDYLFDYIKSIKNDDYQFKPSQHQIDFNQKLSRINIDSQLETIKKDYRTQLDKQIYNICQNIVFSFFSLNDQKFYAVMCRIKEWGLNICIQQFIMDYYLFLKTNNRLRLFIMLHFNKIALTTCSIIEAQLIKKMNLQSFDSKNSDVKQLKTDLIQKQKQILDSIPQDQIKNKVVKPITSVNQAAKLKADILADLKAKNAELQSI